MRAVGKMEESHSEGRDFLANFFLLWVAPVMILTKLSREKPESNERLATGLRNTIR